MPDLHRRSITKTVPNESSSGCRPLETFFLRHAWHVLIVAACLLTLVGWGKWHAGGVRDNSVLG